MIFESHAHYGDRQFDEDREAILECFPESGIGYVVEVASSLESTKAALELASKYPWMYASVGVHPSDIEVLDEDGLKWLREVSANEKCVAIGEIGLDYYWDKEPEVQKNQRYWFERQLELAEDVRKPVIIHSRDAAQDTMDLMKKFKNRLVGGVIHCFSNSVEFAKEYVAMGYYIGIGGVVTFKNAKVLKEVAKEIPLESILLETDCPYMAPEPNRGKRNSSLNLPYVAEMIAELKGITKEEVVSVTCANAKKMYGIS